MIRGMLILVAVTCLLSGCELPADLSLLVNKKQSSGGGSTVSGIPAGVIAYMVGEDSNTNICLWIVDSAGATKITVNTNGLAYRPSIAGGLFYIPGMDFQNGMSPWPLGSPNACYWTMPTNGGTITKYIISPYSGYYPNYGAVLKKTIVDGSGIVWSMGVDESQRPAIWTNSGEIILNSGNWCNVAGFDFFFNTATLSNEVIAAYNDGGAYFYYSGSSILLTSNPSNSGGLLQTNGIIFYSSDSGSVYYSINAGTNWSPIFLPGGKPVAATATATCYADGNLYVAGYTTNTAFQMACYWVITGLTATQVILDHTDTNVAAAVDIQVVNGTVITCGFEQIIVNSNTNSASCYWVGTKQYFLDTGNCAVYGQAGGLTGILTVH